MNKLLRFITFLAACAIALTGIVPAQAQSDNKLTPEERTRAIEEWWERNPDQPRSAKAREDGGIDIPKSVLESMRFDFEKQMAISGHGILFNAQGDPVKLERDQAFELQLAMLEAVQEEDPVRNELNEKAFDELKELLAELDRDIEESRDLKPIQRFALRHLKLRAMAYRLSDERRRVYRWRGHYLWERLIVNPKIELETLVLRWRDILDGLILRLESNYVSQCRNAGVPIPPTWTPSSSAWGNQGTLQQKMISASAAAHVWTWADPHARGGCVALPRGTGGSTDVAGIICQNAANGNACIWDNIGLSSGNRLAWASEPLNVNQLEGAPELAQNCTTCHSGNNVFLVSPDDPTWCKLLRGGQAGSNCAAISGGNAANFTLQVEGNVNQLSGHSRYTPLSGSPARAGWTNNATPGCGGTCHLNGTNVGPPTMPPACGANCN